MGNALISQKENLSPFFQERSFKHLAKKNDPVYGEVSIMSSKLVENYFIVYQTLLFTNKEEFYENVEFFETFKRNPHSNIVNLLDFNILEEEETSCSCSGFVRAQVAYEYFPKTLEDSFSERVEMNQKYQEEEIWNIMKGVLMGLVHIYENKEKINGNFIEMNSLIIIEGEKKIENVKLLNPNINRIANFNHFTARFLEKKEEKIKKEIFSLGVVCSQLMTLNKISNESLSLDQKQTIVEKINKSHYSNSLKKYVVKLLQGNDEEIYNLLALIENLEKAENKIENDSNNNNESFYWRGIDVCDSNNDDSILKKPDIDFSNFDFKSPNKKIKKNDEQEFSMQPIFNLNYNSPSKEKEEKLLWKSGMNFSNFDFKSPTKKTSKLSEEDYSLQPKFNLSYNSPMKDEKLLWGDKENWGFPKFF